MTPHKPIGPHDIVVECIERDIDQMIEADLGWWLESRDPQAEEQLNLFGEEV